MKVKLLSHVRLFGTPWTVAYQDPWSMGFSRQEYWSGLRVPYLGVLPNPGIEPRSPASQADALLGKLEVLKGHSLVHTLSTGLSKNYVSNNHQGQSPVTYKPLEDTVPALLSPQGLLWAMALMVLYVCVYMLSCFSHVLMFATLWNIACHASLPWDSPGKNTGVDCHALLQWMFPSQWSNPHPLCLLHWQADSLPLSHQGSPPMGIVLDPKCPCSNPGTCEYATLQDNEAFARGVELRNLHGEIT